MNESRILTAEERKATREAIGAQHTPGPWEADNHWVSAASGQWIAMAIGGGAEQELMGRTFTMGHAEADANTQLMAASPEMFSTLEGIAADGERWLDAEDPTDEFAGMSAGDFIRAITDAAQEAIVKAKAGEVS